METTKKRFTADDYYRMAEVGILAESDRVELVNGEIIEMTPIGLRHAAAVDCAVQTFAKALLEQVIIRVQNPVRLDIHNEVQPDITLLKKRQDFYSMRAPGPQDVLLIVEISDSSLDYDANIKMELYAACGVQEYWVADLCGELIVTFRDPSPQGYRTRAEFRRGNSLSALAFPTIPFPVDQLLL
jgi:Uma2 family endonuclease